VRIRHRDMPYAHPLRQTRGEDKSAGLPICTAGLQAARRARHRDVPSETGEAGADQGVCFLLVPFLCTSKEKEPRVQGRSHPPLAVEIARKARDTF
jgi:hypothetical protein